MERPEEGTNSACGQRQFRLGRSFSLGRNKQFQYVYRRGRNTPTRLLALTYLRGKTLKVGFSVSGKLGGAVARNRIRRMIREDFRMIRPRLKPGKYILSARVAAKDATHEQLRKELHHLLSKAGVFLPEEDRA